MAEVFNKHDGLVLKAVVSLHVLWAQVNILIREKGLTGMSVKHELEVQSSVVSLGVCRNSLNLGVCYLRASLPVSFPFLVPSGRNRMANHCEPGYLSMVGLGVFPDSMMKGSSFPAVAWSMLAKELELLYASSPHFY